VKRKLRIKDAKALCGSLGSRSVIVIAFDADGTFESASYGETKAECFQTGKVLDRICDKLTSGEIAENAPVERERKWVCAACGEANCTDYKACQARVAAREGFR